MTRQDKPASLTIISWNVNSVRLRLEHIGRLVSTEQPDVLCLQETKAADENFPAEAFENLGFRHRALKGNKNHHGVAILSRLPLTDVAAPAWCGRHDGRHLAATLPGGIRVHNFYVPAGGDEPDPALNDKFAHKLQFMAEMTDWLGNRINAAERAILVGDLNVAPLETDVWSHKKLLKVVSHTPVEVEALERLQRSGAWVDAIRRFVPDHEKLYSWWSYRARDWRTADKGRRLDHIWLTPALSPALRAAAILKDTRDWNPASDHAPLIVRLAL